MNEESNHGGFWKRLVAMIIDVFALMAAGFIAGGISGFLLGLILALMGTDLQTIELIAEKFGYILAIILSWLYFTLMESSPLQATLGKLALGLRVTDLEGRRFGFALANVRYWSKIISAVILFAGFIIAGFTAKKQALHDLIARTLVVTK